MSAHWHIRVYDQEQLVLTADCAGAVELGRQGNGEQEPPRTTPAAGGCRIIMATRYESAISRKHIRAEPLPDGRARLTNQSKKVPIGFGDGSELGPESTRDVTLPVALHFPITANFGAKKVRIEPAAVASPLQSLDERPLPPGSIVGDASRFTSMSTVGMPVESLSRWMQLCTDAMNTMALSPDVFEPAAAALVDLLGMDAGQVLLLSNGQWRVKVSKTIPALAAEDWQPSAEVLTRLLQEKRTFWRVPDRTDGSLANVTALVAAPVMDRGGAVIGALYGNCVHQGRGRLIGRVEAMVAELLAMQVAIGLVRLAATEKLLRIQGDLEIGRSIQAGFLPAKVPEVAGWDVHAFIRSAREVSGDFYDVFALPHGHLALVIADVCDKGVGPALYMTVFRSLFRAFAEQALGRGLGSCGPAGSAAEAAAGRRRATLLADFTALTTIELTNNYVAQTHAAACMFATAFFGVLDITTGVLAYVNAGHDAPMLIRGDAIHDRFPHTGPAVGLWPHGAFEVKRCRLQPGDTLLAYTDGVTEARSPDGKFYGEQRLLAVAAAPAASVRALLDRVVADLDAHVAGAEASDDVTMLAVRWCG